MIKQAKFLVALGVIAVATPAFASNFRAADVVYLPAAGKVGEFSTSVVIHNVTSSSVEIDVAYLPTGQDNRDATRSENLSRVVTLGPMEAIAYEDFFVEVLGMNDAFGQLLFFACRAGGDCINNEGDFRNIIVEGRVYSEVPGEVGTKGQLFSGLPWYSYISSQAAADQLNSARIIGVRQDDRYRSNYGLSNASQYSSTTIRVELFRNNGDKVGQVNKTLKPLSHLQENVGQAFSGFTGEGYLVVTQADVQPTNPDDPDVGDGVPGFFAYGSIVDNETTDPTTLEASFPVPVDLRVYNPDDPSGRCLTVSSKGELEAQPLRRPARRH